MKIKYIGNSKKMSIATPIGESKAKFTQVFHFPQGEAIEMPDDEAKKLLKLDSNFTEIKKTVTKKVTKKKITKKKEK